MAYCTRCGNQLSEGALFCHSCGAPVGAAPALTPSLQRPQRAPMSALTIAIIAIVVVAAIVAVAAIIVASGTPIIPGTVIGSGHSVTQEENLTGFTSVTVSSGFRFTITYSSSYSVNVTTDDNLLSYLQVTRTGDSLSVGLKPGYAYLSATPKVAISMPDITRLDLSGGSSGTMNGFVMSHDFAVTASGGSGVTVSGEGRSLTLEASGGSHLDLTNFSVTNANVDLSGGSQATVHLSGTLDANLSGGSQLYYLGSGTVGNVNLSGGSIVSKR